MRSVSTRELTGRPPKLAIGLALASLAGAFVLVAAQLAGQETAAVVAKLSASAAFIAAALACGAAGSRYGRAIIGGLCLSWFGDAFLLGTTDGLFLAGLVAFLLAHVAYLAAFLMHGIDRRAAALALLPVAAVSAGVLAWLLPHVGTALLIPVCAYLAVISLMVIGAVGARAAGATLLVPAGAIAFYLSDLGVAARQFLEPGFPPYVWSLPLYYLGQVLLALSTAPGLTRPPSRSR